MRVILIVLTVFVVSALPAAAGKYAPTLEAPAVVQENVHFTVSGCGYNDEDIYLYTQNVGLGEIEAGTDGCFSFADAFATGIGVQNVTARQYFGGTERRPRARRDVAIAEITVIP